jgi:uncharacterized RDD family membrane protein YckC
MGQDATRQKNSIATARKYQGDHLNNPNTVSNPYAAPKATVSDIGHGGGEFILATKIERLFAAILDIVVYLLLIIGPLLAFGGAAMFSALTAGGESAQGIESLAGGMGMAAIGGFFVGFLVWVGLTLYFVIKNRQTIGKKLLGIKVVRSDGSTVGIGRLFWLRNVVLALVGGLVGLTVDPTGLGVYVIDSLAIFFGDKNKCLHDRIADTIVVKA